MTKKWIGVDLDGTLAYYEKGQFPKIGEPIPAMMQRVLYWIQAGYRVKIFTARACEAEQIPFIQKWLDEHDIGFLEITNAKDYDMEVLWDDRAVQVETNTGRTIC